VKSKLLDFLLELSDKFSINVKNGKVPSPASINQTFNTTMADGASFVVGDGNTQNITNNLVKGDFNAVKKILKDSGVENSDIEELRTILNNDPVDTNRKEYKKPLQSWIKKMTGKAIDGSWNIGLESASGLITEILKKTLGF